ncbi:MAG: imidazole glycerol phosphate synthase subunit HisF [Candidatus Omnitrophica bacterium]|nr:imidazole glycerol phosphate synthase subunit HisF [Candidatus Omnitrophota bacterium]MDD5430044.1 imidazole glycerol phosphate synthase subunit HisF [Candidatus Omnitrophota bacterium]
MLAKRIIPCLDINNGRVVKGVNFINLRDAGDPVDNAKVYEQEGADELVFLDITASHEKRSTTIDLVNRVAEVVFMPFAVGGGVRNVGDIKRLLLGGAEKVSLNTAAVNNPWIVKEVSSIFGSQCIVVAIDAKLRYSPEQSLRAIDAKSKYKTKGVGRRTKDVGRRTSGVGCRKNVSHLTSHVSRNEWEVYINGGRIPTGMDVVKWAKKVEKLGAGEILLTSMDYDGTKKGFDIELTRIVADAVNIPVIASGGAGKLSDFYEVFTKTKATAALAASIFHYREIGIKEVKKYLKKKGVEVRI